MTTIPSGGGALFRLSGKDGAELTRSITGTMTTSDVARSYLFHTGENQYGIKTRAGATAPGSLVPVDVTVNALDDRGDPLPPQVFNFQIQGPALPPPATHVVISEGPFIVGSDYNVADPGSATIDL